MSEFQVSLVYIPSSRTATSPLKCMGGGAQKEGDRLQGQKCLEHLLILERPRVMFPAFSWWLKRNPRPLTSGVSTQFHIQTWRQHTHKQLLKKQPQSTLIPKSIKLQIKKYKVFRNFQAGREKKTFLLIVKQILAYNYKQSIKVSLYT